MKKIILTLSIMLVTSIASFGQKFAYVDTEYILGQIPEYKAAQTELDKTSAGWQKEIEAKYKLIKCIKHFKQNKFY